MARLDREHPRATVEPVAHASGTSVVAIVGELRVETVVLERRQHHVAERRVVLDHEH